MSKLLLSVSFFLAVCQVALCASVEEQVAFIQTGDELQYFVHAPANEKSADEQNDGSHGHPSDHENNSDYAAGDSRLHKKSNHKTSGEFDVSSHDENWNGANFDRADASGEKSVKELMLNQLIFDPPVLNFGSVRTNSPRTLQISILNPTATPVRFDSISGRFGVDFHASFVADEFLPPQGVTSLDVVYLPRTEGSHRDTLKVHSSLDRGEFSVTGIGVTSSYGLMPICKSKLPLNGSITTPIQLHNPTSETIRITEIYTSGGGLHLELPHVSGLKRAKYRSLWEIPPFATKTVMQARMLGVREAAQSRHYIRIKMEPMSGDDKSIAVGSNASDQRSDYPPDSRSVPPKISDFIVPFEAEVTKKRQLFATENQLNFGVVRNNEKSRVVELSLFSNLNKSVDVTRILITPTDFARCTHVDATLPSHISGKCPSCPVPLARFYFDPNLCASNFWPDQSLSGRDVKLKGVVHVKTKSSKVFVDVPVVVNLITGQLTHDAHATAFYMNAVSGSESNAEYSRTVRMRNTFSVPVTIFAALLPPNAMHVFRVKNMSSPVTVPPGGEADVFNLTYIGKPRNSLSHTVNLVTNCSAFQVNLHVFDGKLKIWLYSIDQDQFDFGLLDSGDRRSIFFSVANTNPVPIVIRNLQPALIQHTSLKLVGSQPGNDTILRDWTQNVEKTWTQGNDYSLAAHSVSVFEYTLYGSDALKHLLNTTIFSQLKYYSIHFKTDYHTISLPVKFSMKSGAVVAIPEKIVFPDAFPGKLSSQALQVYSSFAANMSVLRLSTISRDRRIYFEHFTPGHQDSPVITNGHMSYLGRVFFVPSATCSQNRDCYVGIPLNSKDGEWFVYGLRHLPANLAEVDAYLYQKLHQRYVKNSATLNATLQVDTTHVKGLSVPIEGKLVWPRLMKRNTVQFPLTALGNFSIVNLTVSNPSSHPIIVQIMPLTIYPDPEGVLHYFAGMLPAPLLGTVEMNETLMFTLRDTELFPLRADSPVPRLREEVEDMVGGAVPRFTLNMVLQPKMKVRVRLGFMPKDYTMRSSLLLIRNNLTALETVVLYGQGALVDLKVLPNPYYATGQNSWDSESTEVDKKVAHKNKRTPVYAHGPRIITDRHIVFEIGDFQLQHCENPKLYGSLALTASIFQRRTYYALNTGQVPIFVTNITISGSPCEGRGWRIFNCDPFRLKPNESHVLEIGYTPDFSTIWSEATLQLHSQGNSTPWGFILAASVTPEYRAKCQNALPRPHWEPLLYYCAIVLLGLSLVCVIATAYLEGDRVITCALRQQRANDIAAVAQFRPFDLNATTLAGLGLPTEVLRRVDSSWDGAASLDKNGQYAKTSKRLKAKAEKAPSNSERDPLIFDRPLTAKLQCAWQNVAKYGVDLKCKIGTQLGKVPTLFANNNNAAPPDPEQHKTGEHIENRRKSSTPSRKVEIKEAQPNKATRKTSSATNKSQNVTKTEPKQEINQPTIQPTPETATGNLDDSQNVRRAENDAQKSKPDSETLRKVAELVEMRQTLDDAEFLKRMAELFRERGSPTNEMEIDSRSERSSVLSVDRQSGNFANMEMKSRAAGRRLRQQRQAAQKDNLDRKSSTDSADATNFKQKQDSKMRNKGGYPDSDECSMFSGVPEWDAAPLPFECNDFDWAMAEMSRETVDFSANQTDLQEPTDPIVNVNQDQTMFENSGTPRRQKSQVHRVASNASSRSASCSSMGGTESNASKSKGRKQKRQNGNKQKPEKQPRRQRINQTARSAAVTLQPASNEQKSPNDPSKPAENAPVGDILPSLSLPMNSNRTSVGKIPGNASGNPPTSVGWTPLAESLWDENYEPWNITDQQSWLGSIVAPMLPSESIRDGASAILPPAPGALAPPPGLEQVSPEPPAAEEKHSFLATLRGANEADGKRVSDVKGKQRSGKSGSKFQFNPSAAPFVCPTSNKNKPLKPFDQSISSVTSNEASSVSGRTTSPASAITTTPQQPTTVAAGTAGQVPTASGPAGSLVADTLGLSGSLFANNIWDPSLPPSWPRARTPPEPKEDENSGDDLLAQIAGTVPMQGSVYADQLEAEMIADEKTNKD